MAAPKLTAAQSRARREQVDRVTQAVAAEVEGLSVEAMRALAPILAEAEREVAEKLGKFLTSVGGDERFTAQQLRRALVSIRSAMERVRQLDPVAAGILATQRSSAAAMAAKHVERELAAFGVIFEHSIRPTSIDVAAVFARGEEMLVRRFESSRERYQIGTRVAQDIEKQLALGVAQGESFEQLTQRLIKLGGPAGTVAVTGMVGKPGAVVEQIGEGLFARHEHIAERLVRTEAIEAYNTFADESIRDAAQEDDGICRRWDDSGDVRECSICRELRGVVVGIDQNFPGGIDHPPAHPNCRCAVVAWHRRWKEAGDVRKPLGEPPKPRQRPTAPAQPVAQPKPPTAPVPSPPVQLRFPTQPPLVPPLTPPKPPAPVQLRFPTQPPVQPAPKPPAVTSQAAPKPAPQPSSKPASFDAEAVARAFDAKPEVWQRGGVRKGMMIAGEAGKTIRDSVRGLVESFGLTTTDPDPSDWRNALLSPSNMKNSAGWHVADGSLALAPDRRDGAARFVKKIAQGKGSEIVGSEVRGMRTLVHETTHGTSRLGAGISCYTVSPAAAAVEEVTVEAHARRVLRERFPDVKKAYDLQYPLKASEVDISSRSGYDSWLHHMRRMVEEDLGHTPAQAAQAIEHAAAAMRSAGEAPADRSARAYVSHFVQHLPIPPDRVFGGESGGAVRDKLVDRIMGANWNKLQRDPHGK